MTPLAQAAIAYARAGIAVFPLRPREKRPYGRTIGLSMASADVELVTAWWSGRQALPLKPDEADQRPVYARPDSNIGIATGPAAGFWVLDLDGAAAEEALAALELQNGALPATAQQSTGKGRHLCFEWDDAAPIRNSAGRIGPGIDVRGEGGYIVAPPSIHPGDAKHGIPPGRRYTWTEGLAPDQAGFAAAPDWLLIASAPPPAAPQTSAPRRPHQRIEGRASPYGEAALKNACRDISTAPAGTKNNTLWLSAIGIGRLVAGGEISEQAYALDALREAGRQMCAWSKREEDTLARGFEIGLGEPRSRPERNGPAPVGERRSQATPGQRAQAARTAGELWAQARAAGGPQVAAWFARLGLQADGVPGALARLRLHPDAPLEGGMRGPALLAPLRDDPGRGVEAVAIFDLGRAVTRPCGFLGEPAGKVAILTELVSTAPLVVAIDLFDAWAMATWANRAGQRVRAVACLTVSSFAGGAVGDAYGRVDPTMPMADPQRPPWLMSGAVEVDLVLRRDLRTRELKIRRPVGGTRRTRLEGPEAAAWLGGLAAQAWRRGPEGGAGAADVQLIVPRRAPSMREELAMGVEA